MVNRCKVLMVDLWGCRVGVFATLTNSYALVATGGSMNFYRYGTYGGRKEREPRWMIHGSLVDSY